MNVNRRRTPWNICHVLTGYPDDLRTLMYKYAQRSSSVFTAFDYTMAVGHSIRYSDWSPFRARRFSSMTKCWLYFLGSMLKDAMLPACQDSMQGSNPRSPDPDYQSRPGVWQKFPETVHRSWMKPIVVFECRILVSFIAGQIDLGKQRDFPRSMKKAQGFEGCCGYKIHFYNRILGPWPGGWDIFRGRPIVQYNGCLRWLRVGQDQGSTMDSHCLTLRFVQRPC